MAGKTHIFLDNANIFGGAQKVAGAKEGAPWPCVRVDYDHLFRLLRHGKSRDGVSMLAGSVPPGNDALWDSAYNAGFDTTLLHRVKSDNGRLFEQGVDEAIHLRIGNILLDEEVPGTIVLATGDGAQTDQGCSFTDQVVRAAKRNWKIEVWSWESSLAKRLRDTRLKYPSIKIIKLDEWYHSIVFLKGGTYEVKGQSYSVVARSARSLDLTEGQFTDATLPLDKAKK